MKLWGLVEILKSSRNCEIYKLVVNLWDVQSFYKSQEIFHPDINDKYDLICRRGNLSQYDQSIISYEIQWLAENGCIN